MWGSQDGCEHEWGERIEMHDEREPVHHGKSRTTDRFYGDESRRFDGNHQKHTSGQFCLRCNAWRGSLGLEPTPELYVQHLVEVFREVKRVLRKDGTLWLNMGDCYATGGYVPHGRLGWTGGVGGRSSWSTRETGAPKTVVGGLKPKDLVGMPWRVARALQEPYHVGPIERVEDRAWLAGLIDADGSIGIRVQAPREGRGTNETFIPYLSVSQSDTGALEHAVRVTGLGRINVKDRPREDSRGIRSNRTYYTWRLDGQIASRVIRDIYPYLRIKQTQAQVVYAMNDSLKWGRPTRNLPVPSDVVAARRVLYEGVKRLNQRQPVELPPLPDVPPAIEPGWWLRSEIIWSKPNPMPESVTDRPTRAHEQVFLLTRSARYFYDADAVREPMAPLSASRYAYAFGGPKNEALKNGDKPTAVVGQREITAGRNLRSVWNIATEPFPEAHFATFPKKLVEPCVKAGTSEKGCCPECGVPWARVVEREPGYKARRQYEDGMRGRRTGAAFDGDGYRGVGVTRSNTLGWQPSCPHHADPIPCTVLDPFCGSGTVGVVARGFGRRFIGIELNPKYAEMARRRISGTKRGLDEDGTPLWEQETMFS